MYQPKDNGNIMPPKGGTGENGPRYIAVANLEVSRPCYAIPHDNDELKRTLARTKGEIIKQFELICPTEKSFERSKKNVHDIFDELFNKLAEG